MDIKLSQEEYQNLLKLVAISRQVYGTMAASVSLSYNEELTQADGLIDTLLSYNQDVNDQKTVEEKRMFSESYNEEILWDMLQFKDVSFWDSLSKELAKETMMKKLENAPKTPSEEDVLAEIVTIEKQLEQDFLDNGLANVQFVGELE